MKLVWICPLHRPECAANVRANAARQRFRDFTLIVVENGAAVGAFPRDTGAVVLSSANCHATARNVGLDWALAHGFTHVATHDSDDWYGPAWLGNVACAFDRGAMVVGQRSFLVELSDGTLWRAYHGQRDGNGVMGGTLGFALDERTPRYERAVNDDSLMVRAHATIGRTTTMLPSRGFVYRRSGQPDEHVWQATDMQLRRSLRLHSPSSEDIASLHADGFVGCDVRVR